jgi:cellulose synthase/poly-beta-1,6-N-acetylglucosamine synthase-like glycosyltransferase
MIETLFWLALSWIVYVYVGYPLCLALISAIRQPHDMPGAPPELPAVTLIVSAYNEEAVIAAKVENSLALDYPADRLEVMVVSDACSDRTDDIVRSFTDPRVRLLRMPNRGGKTAGLNAAVAAASGAIVVFSDANAMYVPDAIRQLVRPFADPAVGAVTGEQRYHAADSGSAGEGEGLYWKYELWIKRMESRISSVVGGDGAIYAIRRALYWPMQPEDVSDFVNPVQIVMAGYRNVYAPEAAAYEHSGDSDQKEFRRKVRIVNQSWRACLKLPQAANPLRGGLFAWQLLSHKIMRWWAPLAFVVLALCTAFLFARGGWYAMAGWGQTVCYTLAVAGYLWPASRARPRVIAVPYYFALVNVASMKGIVEAFRGKTYATWATVRS